MPKDWCFWTVVLEKTLDSPLDCKDIQPGHPKGDQSWVFTGRTDVEGETPNILATWCEEMTHLKRPWCWERLRAEGEGDNRGWDGWMASPTEWTWVWVDSVNSGSWWWTGRPGCCSSWGCKESDTTKWLNWTEMPKSQSCRWSSRQLKSKSSCKCDKHVVFVFRMLIGQQNLAKTFKVDSDWLINTLFIISLANIYWIFLCVLDDVPLNWRIWPLLYCFSWLMLLVVLL